MVEGVPPLEAKHEFVPGQLVQLKPDLHPTLYAAVADRFMRGERYRVVAVRDPMIYLAKENIDRALLTRFNPDLHIDDNYWRRLVNSIGLDLVEPLRNGEGGPTLVSEST